MSNAIKVSVVIPVYNSMLYLNECLDSVVNQTLQDIEIICVDDGSTDESISILQSYAQKDSRVHIIQQQNQYAGVARNTGLEVAKGQYVIFWDSDDYFSLDALEKLYQKAVTCNADICICDAQDFDNETGNLLAHNYLRKPYPEDEVFSIRTFKQNIFTFTSPVTWNKLIRKEFLLENQIQFQKTKHINDVLGIFTAMSCADRIVTLPEKLIFYRCNRKDSLMNTYGNKKDSVFVAYRQLKDDLNKKGILDDPEILQAFNNKVLAIALFMMRYCNTYEQYAEYYDTMRQQYFPEMQLTALPENYIKSPKDAERYVALCENDANNYMFLQFKDLHFSNNELRQKNHTLRNKLKNSKEKNASLKERQKESKQKLRSLETELSNTKAELESLQKQVNNMKSSKSYKLANILSTGSRKVKSIFTKNK